MLVIAGAVLNKMVAVLWIIASSRTSPPIQRVVYTYVELKRGWSTSSRSPDEKREDA